MLPPNVVFSLFLPWKWPSLPRYKSLPSPPSLRWKHMNPPMHILPHHNVYSLELLKEKMDSGGFGSRFFTYLVRLSFLNNKKYLTGSKLIPKKSMKWIFMMDGGRTFQVNQVIDWWALLFFFFLCGTCINEHPMTNISKNSKGRGQAGRQAGRLV